MRTLIKNGHVIDPANHIDACLNIVIEGEKIVDVTRETPPADRTIDASGLLVTPGFIDIHMHEDRLISGKDAESGRPGLEIPSAANDMSTDEVVLDTEDSTAIFKCELRMGVTTVLGGNCGQNKFEPSRYLDVVDRDGAAVNVALLAGHGESRQAIGHKDRYTPLTGEEMERLEKYVKKQLDSGCAGISYGIRYDPGATEEELYRMAALCVPEDKMIAAHVRDDAAAIFKSLDEFARIAVKFNLPCQVSHIGSMAGFGQMEEFLRQVDEYRMRGLRITSDCYPYEAFSTNIGAATYDDGWIERYHCDYGVLEICEGKYKGRRCTKEIFDEVRKEHPEYLTVCYVMKGADIDRALKDPGVMLCTDGTLHVGQGHPRAAGSFPRLIDQYVKKGKLSLYHAIRMMTTLPAQKLGLSRKGSLSIGADADITIFDYDHMKDLATFNEPTKPPEGIRYVLLGGKIVLKDGVITDEHCGKSIRF